MTYRQCGPRDGCVVPGGREAPSKGNLMRHGNPVADTLTIGAWTLTFDAPVWWHDRTLVRLVATSADDTLTIYAPTRAETVDVFSRAIGQA